MNVKAILEAIVALEEDAQAETATLVTQDAASLAELRNATRALLRARLELATHNEGLTSISERIKVGG